jgi:hypothetical protein
MHQTRRQNIQTRNGFMLKHQSPWKSASDFASKMIKGLIQTHTIIPSS